MWRRMSTSAANRSDAGSPLRFLRVRRLRATTAYSSTVRMCCQVALTYTGPREGSAEMLGVAPEVDLKRRVGQWRKAQRELDAARLAMREAIEQARDSGMTLDAIAKIV